MFDQELFNKALSVWEEDPEQPVSEAVAKVYGDSPLIKNDNKIFLHDEFLQAMVKTHPGESIDRLHFRLFREGKAWSNWNPGVVFRNKKGGFVENKKGEREIDYQLGNIRKRLVENYYRVIDPEHYPQREDGEWRIWDCVRDCYEVKPEEKPSC